MNFIALLWILIVAPTAQPSFESGEVRMNESFGRLDYLMANSVEKGTQDHSEIRTIHNMLRSDVTGMTQVAEGAFALYRQVELPLFSLGVLNFFTWIGLAFRRKTPLPHA